MVRSVPQRISLCVISGNESCHVERFLDSFKDAFDELCFVRAVGNNKPDNSAERAEQWCGSHGKDYRFAEYRNEGSKGYDPSLKLDENRPETWPHVDDFARARNASWDLATGDWLFWADLDDILEPGSAQWFRHGAELGHKYDQYFFKYAIHTSSESVFRERMFRRGESRWSQPVHENCHRLKHGESRACYEPKCVFAHQPEAEKVRDPMRNSRIMAYHLRFLTGFSAALHQECYLAWMANKLPVNAKEATDWAEVAMKCDIHPETRMNILLQQAHIFSECGDVDHAIEMCWNAVRIAPMRRETWAMLAEMELLADNPGRACMFSSFMQSMPKRMENGFPKNDRYHSWEGLSLRTRCFRAAGREQDARKAEQTVFNANGARFSLIHATRGRPEKAIATRNLFFSSALNPLGVEHIFAIDSDDAESLAKLKNFRHVVVEKPRGCVKAWNAGAEVAEGAVLVQLSDDWTPCFNWDELMWLSLGEEALQRLGQPKDAGPIAMRNAIASVGLVLAISDGHRTDDLLCMAIMTRARYEGQGRVMFHPDFVGLYSDNHLTHCAYRDGVIVKAPHIIMRHEHPALDGKIPWDEGHRRQNHPDRYKEGAAIYERLMKNEPAPKAQ